MDKEAMSIQRNKLMITIFVLIIIFGIFSCIMLQSTPNDEICFRYVYNNRTGEQLSVFMSVLYYLFIWGVLGMLPGGIAAVLTMFLYFFLHRKDEETLNRYHHPKYECELEYGIILALTMGYVAVLVLVLLHASNIATIQAI